MKTKHAVKLFTLVCLSLVCLSLAAAALRAADPAPPVINSLVKSNATRNVRFDLYPAAAAYTFYSTTNLSLPFVANTNFALAPYFISTNTVGTNYGYEWRATNAAGVKDFYQVAVTPLSSNALLTAQVLNRLAYGPTPDELARVTAIGPQAFIDEQLAPWNLAEDVDTTHTNFATLNARFAGPNTFVETNSASLADLRAWHTLRAIGARRQLLEILLQFWENHFVTQESKSDSSSTVSSEANGTREQAIATSFEKLENDRWRAALLNPTCTFYDLLKASAESPAMIIYLDTVTSRGDATRVANENYARELLELFTFGVDNGYDQNDITVMSRAWTGWTLKKVDLTNAANPFAAQTTAIYPGSTNGSLTTISNLYGVWAFSYNSSWHNNSNKIIFPAKTVPARFGAPWAGANYQLTLTNGSGTNSIQDGYQVLAHLANQPFTEEYLSVKLCRLLVHDNFPNPSNDPTTPAYTNYNYAAGNLSPEAALVRACMNAWETNSPKGQIWPVLRVITDSDLFRSHGGVAQKVKTPFEFAVSVVRALRSGSNQTYTASSDGYAIGGTSATSATLLTRAGNMLLFDRDAPDGYPETAAPWVSAGTLAERVRFAQSFCIAYGQSGHSGSFGSSGNDAGTNVCSPVDLLSQKLPAASLTNATAVADYFVSLLFPGEGAGNVQLYRNAAVNFLNDGSADTTTANTNKVFSALPVSNNATNSYDQRVRGAVGLLMSTQRFQEQ
ncbi:MAG: hypothetical protein RLZZ350_863 [Verrucomicrobiota bacterium]|jgi:uncharacterized protein (DUF1800 family)